MAYELQAAKTRQRIKEEQMEIKVVERKQEIAVQEQEMQRREKELIATIRQPAEAEKYRYYLQSFHFINLNESKYHTFYPYSHTHMLFINYVYSI